MNNAISLGIGKEAKAFSWSYSKLKNYDSCPRKHLEVDLLKRFKEDEESGALKWGNLVHDALAKRVRDGTALPFELKHLEPAAEQILSVPGKRLVEQQLAITAEFLPCEWFSRQAWFRAVADVIVLNPPVAFVVDYKTGKLLDDSQQLALMSACVFAHHPDIQAVRAEFWWLREDTPTQENFKRSKLPQIWRDVWPRYQQLENAYLTGHYPPKPSGLCKAWCPVTSCEYNGKYAPTPKQGVEEYVPINSGREDQGTS